nr:branched-chain amino acid ABC transporter permease [Agrococcus sp. ARC_14]
MTLPLWLANEYWVLVAADICIFAIFGMSYNVLLGQMGLFSLGQALFFGFASYTVANLTKLGVDIVTAILLAIAMTAAVGFVLGLMTSHIRGIFFGIVTLAIAQAAFTAAGTDILGLTGGENGLRVTGLPDALNVNFGSTGFYMLTAVLMLVVLGIMTVLKRAPIGSLWAGIRDNRVRAQSLGVNIAGQKLVALTVSGAIAGLAGALNAVLLQIASPEQLGLHIQVQVLLIVIIGGPGTLLGPILGAFLVRLSGPMLDQLDRQAWVHELPTYLERAVTSHDLVLGIVYILLVLFVPGGLISLVRRRRSRVKPVAGLDEPAVPAPSGART